MKIDDSTGKIPPAAPLSDRPATTSAVSTGTTVRSTGEQVSLSGSARALIASNDEAPMDVSKVAALRQQIADGSYRIDAGKIADSLISAARELVSRQH